MPNLYKKRSFIHEGVLVHSIHKVLITAQEGGMFMTERKCNISVTCLRLWGEWK